MPTSQPKPYPNSKHGSSRHGSSRHGSSRHNSSWHGSSMHGSSIHGSSTHGSSWHGSTQSELIPIPVLRSHPPRVHAASLFSLQIWAFSELWSLIPPPGERVRNLRLFFLGIVAALSIALVLSHPFNYFVRLFSTLHSASVRRRHALLILAVFLALTSLVLGLAEGWHPVDTAYFVSATISTIGCGDFGPRSLFGKLMASLLSMVGPLTAALFWRGSASHDAVDESRERSVVSNRADGVPLTSSGHNQDHSVERGHESRVADAIWAFVGMLMVLVTCAAVFLRAAYRGDITNEDDMDGSVAKPTLVDAVYHAFMMIATVGPSNPPFSEPLSRGSRAVMTPIMLVGAAIFSRLMWAVVHVLLPPALAPASFQHADPVVPRGTTAISDGFKNRSTSGGESLHYSPAAGSWRGNRAAASTTVYRAKTDIASTHHDVKNQKKPRSKENEERSVGVVLKENYPDRIRMHSDSGGWGRETVSLKEARQPSMPFLPPTTAVIDFDDEEDDGWVSEDDQVIDHNPEDDCDEIDWNSHVEEERDDDGPDDEIEEVCRVPMEGNGGHQVSTSGASSYVLDDTPQTTRSWHAGSVHKTDPSTSQTRSGEGRNLGGAKVGTRREGGDGRDVDHEEDSSNHHGTLESVEEGDEDASDFVKSPFDESSSQKVVRMHRLLEQSSGAALVEDSPRSIDVFIVKKLMEQGKLGREEAAQMMLEFERTAVRSTSHCTDSFKKTSKGKNGDKATSTRTPRHKGSVEAPQGSISNASGAGRNSRRGQAAGLESLENPPRPLHLDVDARQTLNGRRRGHESAAAAANTAGLSPHGVSSPTFEAPLPPPGL